MALFKNENLIEEQLTSDLAYNGGFLKVYKDEVKLPNEQKAFREYIKHVGAVAVVALTDDHKVIMEKQFRYPFNKIITEIPAGKLNSKQEDPLEAIKRELQEETGIQADNYIYMGPLYPSVAYTDEVIHLYLATGLHYGQRNLDEDEFLNIELIDIKEVVEKIIKGEIADSKTQAAILKAYYLINK